MKDKFKVVDVNCSEDIVEEPMTVFVWRKGEGDSCHYKAYLFGEDPEDGYYIGVGSRRQKAMDNAYDWWID